MQPPVEDTKKSAESYACDYMIELFHLLWSNPIEQNK